MQKSDNNKDEKKDFFPYPSIRKQQKEMMNDIKKVLESKKHLIADAPTGLGKTIAALYPSVKYSLENKKTVFFLTSRLSQHKAAIETLRLMKNSGMDFSVVDIIGKKHLCSQDVDELDSGAFSSYCSSMIKHKQCSYYKNFHNPRIESKNLIKLAKLKSPLSSEEAKNLFSYKFCTFEALVELSRNADVIVGDYFHIFGSDGLLKKTGKKIEESIIIVDEAHNLSSRIRSHLSSKISTRICELASKEAGKFLETESKSIAKRIEKEIEGMSKLLFNEKEVFIKREDLIQRLSDYENIISTLYETGEKVLEEKKVSFSSRIAEFLILWQKEDFGYSRILAREKIGEKEHFSIYFNCLDPSIISKEIIEKSHSTILMSGTLSPMEFHRDILGLNKERTEMKSYSSPFPKENRKNIIATGITTKYTERTSENIARIATTVRLCIENIKGNAAVFFPSYEMRDHIHSLIEPTIKKHIILEKSSMKKEEKDKIKDEMKKHSSSGAVLFGVMGGSFSEGIDLPGNLLNGVIIVGLPLEKPTLSVKALIDYYEKRFNRGRDYGYNFPAMIKVMQAAGRCIRTEKDRGIVVFADERFTWKNYRNIFPKNWDFSITSRPEIEIKKFFS